MTGRASEDTDPEDGMHFFSPPSRLIRKWQFRGGEHAWRNHRKTELRLFNIKHRCAGAREEGVFQLLGIVYPYHAPDRSAFHELFPTTAQNPSCA